MTKRDWIMPMPAPEPPTLRRIAVVTADAFGLHVDALMGKSRVAERARPRQIAMALARRLTTKSLPEIGRFFGRDHTTVIHSLRAVETREAKSPEFRDALSDLASSLTAPPVMPVAVPGIIVPPPVDPFAGSFAR